MKFLENVAFSIIAGGLAGVTVALVILSLLNSVMGIALSEGAEQLAYIGCSVAAAAYVLLKVSVKE